MPPDEPADEPRRAREWYGLPLVVLDGLALATIGVGRGIGDDAVLITGAVGGIVNGLVIHTFAYDEKHRFTGLGKGLLSVALRGGLAGLGCSAGSGCGELEDAALLRLSLGIAVGAAIDDALLAYKPRKTSGQAARFTVFPLLSRGSAGAAMAGSF